MQVYKVIMIFLISLFAFSSNSYAVYLYNIEDEGGSVVSLKTLLDQPTTEELVVAKLNIYQLNSEIKKLEIPINNDLVVSTELINFETTDNQASVWQGRIVKVNKGGYIDDKFKNTVDSFVTLIRADNRLTGMISIRGKIYTIKPLDEYRVAIITLDSSKFPDEGEPITIPGLDASPAAPTNGGAQIPFNPNALSEINILFITTPEAFRDIGENNYRGFIAMAATSLQQNADNSNLRIRYRVRDTITNIPENGRTQLQLIRAMQTPDNDLGRYTAYARNRERADMVQLVVIYNGVCGLGNHLNGSLDSFRHWAFSTVWQRCVENFTHVHEFGHNFGAMHDINTERNIHFPWGFGFRDTAVVPGFSTVMTSCAGCSRINMFSSPLLRPNGRPMGTTMEDNQRVVDQTRHNAAMVFPNDPGNPVDPEYPVDPGYPTGDYDYVFPYRISTYRAGTRVLQPRNNIIYECRPFPNEGFCRQWSPSTPQFEPGFGSNWRDAWIQR
ncbi:M12 family metallo-peptidase [Candidatus Symbiopectobacterium sp. NZEC135]|uniref:M12 family metallo-peptidase n=1 Tax=Candidatus Symbiopectobacterium sp. NZEC135 TaxID=2820471 RepID=UPI002227AB1E|nr:zinc-dependent metalloprotease family protein [Candidatus Symbiopectobacterium sp. NZEC135]MCW2481393.1 hypothetical protein [Candidatus Symbiopectobacterium sp. NZEC135]